jgi:hypothetical protein
MIISNACQSKKLVLDVEYLTKNVDLIVHVLVVMYVNTLKRTRQFVHKNSPSIIKHQRVQQPVRSPPGYLPQYEKA